MQYRPRTRIVMTGAIDQSFHNFNQVYREDPTFEVVAFTAPKASSLVGSRYPAALAGPLYLKGLPIIDEVELERCCRRDRIDQAVFAADRLQAAEVMQTAARVMAAGASFGLLGPAQTQLSAAVPVLAVSALSADGRPSRTSRWLVHQLRQRGLRLAAVPLPLRLGAASLNLQRFASLADLAAASGPAAMHLAYQPYLAAGATVYAGADYGEIVRRAEEEADVILWDGSSDVPFIRPDLHIAVLEPQLAAASQYSASVALQLADVVVVETDAADEMPPAIESQLRQLNAKAAVQLGHNTDPASALESYLQRFLQQLPVKV
jgi:predicted GTPase